MLILFAAVVGYIRHQEFAASKADLELAIRETDAIDSKWRFSELLPETLIPPGEENGLLLVKELNEDDYAEINSLLELLKSPETGLNSADSWEDSDFHYMLIDNDSWQRYAEFARQFQNHPKGSIVWIEQDDLLRMPIYHVQNLQSLCELLNWDTRLSLIEGNSRRALANLRAMINMSRCFMGMPAIIHLVRIAGRNRYCLALQDILNHCELDEETLASLNDELILELKYDPLLAMARGERAMMSEVFDRLNSGRIQNYQLSEENRPEMGLPFWFWWYYQPKLDADHAYFLRTMNKLHQLSRSPESIQFQQRDSVSVDFDPATHFIACLLFSPSVTKWILASLHDKALIRSALAAIACEQYRLREGEWPTSLREAIEYLPNIPNDPYIDKPIKFSRSNDGVVIYSVGENGTDNQGKELKSFYYRFSQEIDFTAPYDIGFTLRDPAQRDRMK